MDYIGKAFYRLLFFLFCTHPPGNSEKPGMPKFLWEIKSYLESSFEGENSCCSALLLGTCLQVRNSWLEGRAGSAIKPAGFQPHRSSCGSVMSRGSEQKGERSWFLGDQLGSGSWRHSCGIATKSQAKEDVSMLVPTTQSQDEAKNPRTMEAEDGGSFNPEMEKRNNWHEMKWRSRNWHLFSTLDFVYLYFI